MEWENNKQKDCLGLSNKPIFEQPIIPPPPVSNYWRKQNILYPYNRAPLILYNPRKCIFEKKLKKNSSLNFYID